MDLQLKNPTRHILILGAGASVDYGLPVWSELKDLIKKELLLDLNINYRKEILEWLGKVGRHGVYDTIDRCIQSESASSKYPDGASIEDELFFIMKNLFEKRYKDNEGGWIKILNDKILNNMSGYLDQSLAFVNFNYDNVLERNFLNFSYLHPKHRLFNYRDRLNDISEIKAHALYPHGKFSSEELEDSHILIRKQTMKSIEGPHLDVVSCYESYSHRIYNSNGDNFQLYLMGLGGGLKINLDHINFPYNVVSTVHVTIKDSKLEDEVTSFLSKKYEFAEIKKYSTCEDLIVNCFND